MTETGTPQQFEARTAADTEAFGARVAAASQRGVCIHLHGALAAGKTTFARGYLRGLGYRGAVKSPTFTLVESYDLPSASVHHFDLYRLADAEELEFIGVDEYFGQDADCLVEWAERGDGVLPAHDLAIRLEITDRGRTITVTPGSGAGIAIISRII